MRVSGERDRSPAAAIGGAIGPLAGAVHRQFVYPDPGQREVMCHNDTPSTCVFDRGTSKALSGTSDHVRRHARYPQASISA